MKQSLFRTRGKVVTVLVFFVTAFILLTSQKAFATTYTSMDAQGNLVQSSSLKDAVSLARATGRPIALDPGHSDGTNGRDPGATYHGVREGDITWATAMYTKKYLEEWGIPVVVVRGEHEDPSLATRVERAVAANACAIISLHYNAGGPSASGSEVLVPRKAQYNSDLYEAGQKLAEKVNYYLRNKAGVTTRGNGRTERGYNDAQGTDYYANGDESDYYSIVRNARKRGILGVIIEHEFISNPSHAAEFKNLDSNSKVDYIGWADAWAIWEMYHSDTWWSMSSFTAKQSGATVTIKPVITGVMTDAKFTAGYTAPDGSWTTIAYRTSDSVISFTPPMSGNYTLYVKAISADGQEVARQMSFYASAKNVPGWSQVSGGWKYADSEGNAYINRWLKDSDGWHYFNGQGICSAGWFKDSAGRYWYADASSTHNTAQFGQITSGGSYYYIDESHGMISNDWVNLGNNNWAWATSDGSYKSGWMRIPNGKWFYFDENNDHKAIFGLMSDGSNTYYIDLDRGLLSNGWVDLGNGSWAWANTDGSLYSGWKYMSNGKWFYFDESTQYPLLKTGIFTISSGTYFVDVNAGMTANGWVQLPNNGWAWAQSSGAFASGWFTTPNGKTWYFDPNTSEHGGLFGKQLINGCYYYFDVNYGLLKDVDVMFSDGTAMHADKNGVLSASNDSRAVDDSSANRSSGADADTDNTSSDFTHASFSGDTSILGNPTVSKEALQADFKKRVGSAYLSIYAEKGAPTGTDFVNQLWSTAISEGVRPEVLYAQVMIETGALRFDGDVLPDQCNFGGLGATGGGERGCVFGTVQEGLRAQAIHLRAYAGQRPLTIQSTNDDDIRKVDPRYGSWILAKKVDSVSKLSGTWAMDKAYATKLVRIMNEL